MRKYILVIFFLLLTKGTLSAQDKSEGGTSRERTSTVIALGNMYDWRPFDNRMGATVYGSRFRKARADLVWGRVLSLLVTPACLFGTIDGFAEGRTIQGIACLIPTCTAIGFGIPIWIKGRKELDYMVDDYSTRYAPQPRASLNVGSTPNGIGLALNF